MALDGAPEDAPNQPREIELTYERGDPVALDGNRLTPGAMLAELNRLGGMHAVGRSDIVENRFVGMKSRGCYETPGGTILLKGHRAMESLTLDREVGHLKDELMPRYAQMIYNGYWWAPERKALQALIDESQTPVNGSVVLKLYKGSVTVVGRSSDDSLYDADVVTFEDDQGAYDQKDAAGFIKLNALRLRLGPSGAGIILSALDLRTGHCRWRGAVMNAKLPIGVFDSGMGGLTVLAALRQHLPTEDFIYFGDTARLPYGTKSPATVQRYAQQAAGALVARGIKALVIACNTASATALHALARDLAPLPVFGVVEPGAMAAGALADGSGVTVLATESTIAGGAYQRALLRQRSGMRVVEPTLPAMGNPCRTRWRYQRARRCDFTRRGSRFSEV